MKKILVVEDQPDIRELVRLTLEIADWTVLEARTGEEGLRQAATHNPDVVLLDVMMPGTFDGLDVCRRLRGDARFARTKIVFLSARGQARDVEAGLAAGGNVYLAKPFSPRQLLETVRPLA